MNDSELRQAYSRVLARTPRAGSCPSPEALLALAEKQGSETDRLVTLDHAMSCDACRHDLELLRVVANAGHALSPRVSQLLWRAASPWRLAAAAVFVVAVASIATFALRRDGEVTYRGGDGPVLISPPDSVLAYTNFPLMWRRVPNAVRYHVEMLSATGEATFAAFTSDTTLLIPVIVSFARGREYIWSVRAVFPDGTQAASVPRRFRIQP